MPSCKTLANCKYPLVKKLLLGAGYPSYSCKCEKIYPAYSFEWDSEYRENFKGVTSGRWRTLNLLENLLSNPKRLKGNLPELYKTITQIDANSKKQILKLLAELKTMVGSMVPYVTRLSLFQKGLHFGWIELTPLNTIGDVFIAPPKWMCQPEYFVTCARAYTPIRKLRVGTTKTEVVTCVPYNMTNAKAKEVGVCAQYAARLALMVMSPSAPTVPELTFRAVRKFLVGGIERTQEGGLYPEEITKILEAEGHATFDYSNKLCECGAILDSLDSIKCSKCGHVWLLDTKAMRPTIENIYAYVESGIPVILCVDNAGTLPWWKPGGREAHALVAIGHTLSKDGKVNGLIVHDVSKYPYLVLNEPKLPKGGLASLLSNAIVPVPKEVQIRYENARKVMLEFVLTFQEYKDLETKGLLFRPLLIEADEVKQWLGGGKPRDHFKGYKIPKEVNAAFSEAHLDRYVWLFEFRQDITPGKRKYLGDVLISATSGTLLGYNLPACNRYAFVKDNKLNNRVYGKTHSK